MEFWGIEVKPGKPIKTNPDDNHLIHLSQASLGESKNKPEAVVLYVNVDGKKLVLGTLTQQNGAQLSFDLVFDKEFELSHNCKNGSVYFLGYKADMPEEGDDDEIDSEDVSSEEEEEEELPVVATENGKPKVDTKTAKANADGKPNAVKQGVKIAEPIKKDEDDSDSEDGSGSDDEDDSEDEDNEMSMDGSSDDEETPKKVELSKKRPAEAPTPVSGKKAKSADGKKGGHVATPHPSKTAAKTSGKSPKSGGQFSCETCSKTFGSGGGLESHKKAKHGGK